MKSHLVFKTELGRQKPNSIHDKTQSCPFCAREALEEILDENGSMILLKNKYPVLQDTFQTVLIESDDCHGELSIYPFEYVTKLIQFGLTHWLTMSESGEYESVIFFKNHGPLSGGSIAHPHMQIIGLHRLDYTENLQDSDFEGLPIHETNGTVFSLSTMPRVGFYELNILLGKIDDITAFAKYIQTAAHYILHQFPLKCTSYNLFFYEYKGRIYAKMVPRFITTPLFIGYSLPQVPNDLEWMRRDIQEKYFTL